MDNRRVNILIGMKQNEEFAASVTRSFEKAGIYVNRAEIRSGKKQIFQYLEVRNDVDIVIVSCGQEQGSFEVKELDIISQHVPEKNFIVIISDDMYGSDFLVQLAACGIYTGVFEKDATIEYVVDLIKNGRSRVDARTYYGIQKNGGFMQIPIENFDTAQCIAFLNSYGGTVESLHEKMRILGKRLQPTELMQLITELPEDLFMMLHRIPEYTTVCNMIAEQRMKTSAPPVNAGKRVLPGELNKRRKETDKSGAKLSPKDMLGMDEKRASVEIGFTGFNTGAGCTYQAIMMAHAIADTYKNKRVAIVEFDSEDASFYSLCRLATGNQNISGLTSFKVKNVTYFFNMPYGQFIYEHRKDYDYVVYDFGCCNNDTIRDNILPLDKAFAVVNTNEWRYGELSQFHADICRFDVRRKLVYLMPSMDPATLKDAVDIVGGHDAYPIGYEKNPYNPSTVTQKLLINLMEGKKVPKKVRTAGGFKSRLNHKTSVNPIVLAFALLVIVCAVCCYLVHLNGTSKYEALRQKASSLFSEKEAEIASLQEELGNLSATLSEKERTVVFLTRNVSAGELITEDMVEERVICMDVPQDQYFQMAYIGYYVMAVDMYAGEPIHASNVKRYEEAVNTDAEKVKP